MTVDQDSQIINQYNSMKRQGERLYAEANLTEISRDVSDTSAEVSKLPGEIGRIRSRGYVFAAYLEQKADVLSTRWNDVRLEVQRVIDSEIQSLRGDMRQVEFLLERADRASSNPTSLQSILPSLERETNDLENKIKSAEARVKQLFSELERDVNQTVEQLQDIIWYLDQKDEASFPFLAGENLFLAAKAEWVVTGKSGKDPDGILYLTDQRLVFEQKETTGKTLGLFGGKHTQELEWDVPLHLIKHVEAENKGLFGGKDILHFILQSGAPYAKITLEVKGGVKCKFWKAQIERMIAGETTDERAIQPDPEVLESIRNAPTACHVCGATLPQLVASQRQMDCGYCGSVIRL